MPLIGREPELRALDGLLDRVHERGDVLVVRGDAGIGKSSVLAAAADHAGGRGMSILRTVGVQAETELPFAGLHQLLRPILGGADELPAPQRDALSAAFGLTDTAAPEPFLIALAALDLLAGEASRSPLLLIADDAQWLDRPTCDVLTFVARRVPTEPMVLLVGARDGYDSPFFEADLPELRLLGLDASAAADLLDAHAPDIAPALQRRLLSEAAGNPLALAELPVAARSRPFSRSAAPPDVLPLTTRLERAFATRASELPSTTQTMLLVAAANDGGLLAEVLAATESLDGDGMALDALAPAVRAGLVMVDMMELHFRHPLVRSAIYQAAGVSSRLAAHAALAAVLSDEPDRRVWHRAAATIGPDEEVTAELDEAAARAVQRGGIAVAVAAYERAALLDPNDARRAGRLLRAAEMAFELGRRDVVIRLLREAKPLGLSLPERGRMVWIEEMISPHTLGDAERASLIELAHQARAAGDTDVALNLLWLVASRCWWAEPTEQAQAEIVAAADRFGPVDGDLRLLAVLAYVAPVARGHVVHELLARSGSDGKLDAGAARLLGSAALVAGAFDLSAGFLATAVEDLRAQGRLGHLGRVLVLHAWSAVYLGDWDVAIPAADEGGRLATETREPIWVAGSQVVHAILAASRGQTDVADALTAKAEQAVLPLGVNFMLACVQLARGLSAIGGGRHADAYGHLLRLFDPGDPAYHPFMRAWAIGDLAEAAVQAGQRETARALLADLEPLLAETPSPWIHASVRYARPFLAVDEDTEALFREALDGMTRWPFHRARLLLAYGTWLRRRRRVAESRVPIHTAGEIFEALGATAWYRRAGQELRASGKIGNSYRPDTVERLTPQELQVAQMAAHGLSNREIGQRLFLSHRTVGSHLYRVFPKLGVTSRSQLRDVVSDDA